MAPHLRLDHECTNCVQYFLVFFSFSCFVFFFFGGGWGGEKYWKINLPRTCVFSVSSVLKVARYRYGILAPRKVSKFTESVRRRRIFFDGVFCNFLRGKKYWKIDQNFASFVTFDKNWRLLLQENFPNSKRRPYWIQCFCLSVFFAFNPVVCCTWRLKGIPKTAHLFFIFLVSMLKIYLYFRNSCSARFHHSISKFYLIFQFFFWNFFFKIQNTRWILIS